MRILFAIALAAFASVCAFADSFTLARRATSPAAAPLPEVPDWYFGETDTNHIDVLIAFDVSAKRWLAENGRDSGAFAKWALDDLNASLAYTGLDRLFTFRLAGVCDIDLDLSESSLAIAVMTFSDTPNLQKKLDNGVAQRIRAQRDAVNADIVAVLSLCKEANVYGYSDALEMEDLDVARMPSRAESAYCAIKIDELEKRHTLLHEIGHLLGAGHADTQHKAPGPGLFPFSSAYRFHAGDEPLVTATGYPEVKDGRILPFFSSQDYTVDYTSDDGKVHKGLATGGPSNDNTRTVAATCKLVSQFRVSRPSAATAKFDAALKAALVQESREAVLPGETAHTYMGIETVLRLDGAEEAQVVTPVAIPQGLKWDGEAKELSGRFSKAGENHVVFRFGMPGEAACVRRRFVFAVRPLPDWAKGRFVNADGMKGAVVSEKGGVTLQERRAYKSDRTDLGAFVSVEERAGEPVAFSLKDGARVELVSGHGELVLADGERLLPRTKKTPVRQRKQKKSFPKENRKTAQ